MAGLYIHIPFCKQRCIYCDFYSTTRGADCDRYVETVCKEMVCRADYLKGREIETIYLGGGTPSLLTEIQLQKLVNTWQENFQVASGVEITLEANPDDLTAEYAHLLFRNSVNRISLGVQTFQDSTLRLLNRRHSSDQVYSAVNNLREAGFRSISMDLIYGLPGEKWEQWKENVDRLLELRPAHLSAYLLTVEEGTRLDQWSREGRVVEMDEETAYQCYSLLVERVEQAGYDPYEISNFALPGFYSRHNSNYWKGVPYLGCGPSAHSFDGKSRQWNTADLSRYLAGWLENSPVFEKEELDLYTRYNEYIMTRLRTKRGISLTELTEIFGNELTEYALQNARLWLSGGQLSCRGDTLGFTKEGVFVSDAVMRDLLYI